MDGIIEVLNAAVASSRARIALRPSNEKPSACRRVILQPVKPTERICQEINRELALCDNSARCQIEACFLGNRPWPLLLYGSPGTGKTCAALAFADLVPGSVYFSVPDLCEQLIRSALGRMEWSHEGRGGVIWPDSFRQRFIANPPLLILDELGLRSNVSDAHYEAVYRSLDIRLRLNKPLILISNLGPAALEKVYDARTGSRMASGTVLAFDGLDRRLI